MYSAEKSQVPVTILSGFLGAGKTTLLRRILSEQHGHKIAVIENEFGEEGIDNDILVREEGEQIIEMNNGCICCTVRGDLVRILGDLKRKRKEGKIDFERVIIETTGLAAPAPVAQTFFIDDEISAYYLLDAIVVVVDAQHAGLQLDQHHEAQEQVGFADRLLLSKTDLVSAEVEQSLRGRLHRLNPRAPVQKVHFGEVPLKDVLDIRGFSLNSVLEITPDFLENEEHEHDDAVQSFVFRANQPIVLSKLEDFLAEMIEQYGVDMMRYKGVLHIAGQNRRIVFQGVHTALNSDVARPWGKDEKRESRMVFIGRNLPKSIFIQGLNRCLLK